MPASITNNLGWAVSLGIVALGLFVYGLPDLLRSRPGRVWAIGGVCFRDAIRRRVLWITPLAMLGIIAVSQFQKPFDEQDAVRSTIKVCLFTTGLVVTIIALVTAATNLPREIDNRVVFTIVTKPVTRLEIVLGKIVGFARVSAVMLLVMGLFTLLYLHGQSWWLNRGIRAQLDSGSTEGSRRIWLEHFRDEGLLQSRSLVQPATMMQYARPPEDDNGGLIVGGTQDAIVRIPLTPTSLESALAPGSPGAAGLVFYIKVGYEPVHAPPAGTTQPSTPPPSVTVQVIDLDSGSVVLSAEQIGKDSSRTLTDPTGQTPVYVQVAPEKATQLASLRSLDVQLICSSAEYLYRVHSDSVTIVVPDSDERGHVVKGEGVLLRGSSGRGGQQLPGPGHGVRPVQVYAFRNAPVPATVSNNRVPFELNVGVDSTGDLSEREPVGTIEVRAKDRKSGRVSEPVVVYPESKRTVFFDLPDEFVKSGDFDLQVQNASATHTIGVTRGSLSMVAGREYFGLNLVKALVVVWLLSVLAATVAFWCSTFLSWPIAVVLSTLIILGHWAVSNVDLGSGIGAAVANEMVGSGNAPVARVVNTSVENLSRVLVMVSNVLPDITAFGITDRIEKGTSLTIADMAQPLGVLAMFGLPLVTVAYVFLRNKEVAP